MFGKSDTARIGDTLTVITGAGPGLGLSAPVTLGIKTLVNTQFPRLTAADRAAYSQLSSEMSVKAAIPGKAMRGSDGERELRRAIYLLWITIGKSENDIGGTLPRAQAAMTMGTGALNAAFVDVMLKAAAVSSAAGAQHVFDQLVMHPANFLKTHRTLILGIAAGGPQFSTAPNGVYQNVHQFYFHYDAGQNRFLLSGVPTAGISHAFQTVSVPAVHWSQVPGVGAAAPYSFAGILGCELVGANVMVTTQFTGCAFSWTDQGGVVRASHVSPAGGLVGGATFPGGGHGLAQRIVATGAHSNAGLGGTAATVFGAGAGNAPMAAGGNMFYPDPLTTMLRWVTIFGTTKGGAGWRLYMQAVDGNLNIIEARRIM